MLRVIRKATTLSTFVAGMIALAPMAHATIFPWEVGAPSVAGDKSGRVSGLAGTGSTAVVTPIDVAPLPSQSNPYGASYATWGARWWQWAVSSPVGANPIQDEDGSFCDVGQSGPVWFLAGNFGGTTVRSCDVPVGKSIFFPIVNFYVNYPCPPEFGFEPAPGQSLEEFLQGFVDPFLDEATNLSLEVDGVSIGNVSDFRATSELFLLSFDPSWSSLDPCVTGTPQPSIADGYWIMLPALPVGAHTIHFHGELPSFGFALDVTYNLTVFSRGGRGGISSGPGDVESAPWGVVKRLYR